MRTWGRVLVASALVVSLGGLAGCSDTGVEKTDVYKVGCPALDAVLGGGALGSKAAVSALQKLRDQPDVDAQTARWLDTAISALASTEPDRMPSDAKQVLVKGCADNGYTLRNLTS